MQHFKYGYDIMDRTLKNVLQMVIKHLKIVWSYTLSLGALRCKT
jgi:hypothetical protein